MGLLRGADGGGTPVTARALRMSRAGSAVLVLGVAVPTFLAAGTGARAVAALVLAVAQAVLLRWVLIRPGAVLAGSALLDCAMWLLFPALSLTGAFLGAQIALCVVSALRPVRISRWWLLGMLALAPLAYTGAGTLALVTHVLAVTLAWTAGQWRRAHQDRLAAETRRAVAEERARIAREVHDVVAHTVSVMVIQASAADDVFTTHPEQARNALRAIDSAGRSALAELRLLLRAETGEHDGHDGQDGHDAAGGPGGADDDGRRPARGLGDLAGLAANARAAGLTVELHEEGTGQDVPAAVGLAAYRIVQEALTNTMRHAGASRVRVSVCRTAASVRVEVSDNGRPGNRSRRSAGAGRGLAGMRERATLLGGTLEAGPGPGGGFEVHAELPIRYAP
ncbi:sensor histidine kinase [Streptomyces sp. NBC_00083]|uniref:sensor histidine kinase n=1 Tax=Streptomyces sp. NBC_00083 TaxID=2975647 RepID=UPI0022501BE9|nr:sensor histidine kinase [Streptomyces sp. NBC_00083]MCX5386396.1 histidine kinase [Streptomyces sp. NBC_00083]